MALAWWLTFNAVTVYVHFSHIHMAAVVVLYKGTRDDIFVITIIKSYFYVVNNFLKYECKPMIFKMMLLKKIIASVDDA